MLQRHRPQATRLADGAAHGEARDGPRHASPAPGARGRPPPRRGARPRRRRGRTGASASSASTDGRAGERVAHGGVEARLQVREQLVADAVAEDRRIRVGRVLAPLEAMRRRDGRARRPATRAASGAARRRARARMAPRPALPDPRSRRRRTVSAWSSRVWASSDRVRLLPDADRLEKGAALVARRLLDPAPVARGAGADVGAGGAEGDAERAAQPAAEGGVLARAGAQAVIEVRGDHAQAAAPDATAWRSATESAPPESPTTTLPRRVLERREARARPRSRGGCGAWSAAPRARLPGAKAEMVAVQGLEPRTPRI